MTELQERKRLVQLQAELQRTLLRAEVATVRARWSWLKDIRETARSTSPWWTTGAAILGLLAAWRGRSAARWIPVALAAWKALRRSRPGGPR
ncbi:MAG TPA: hypothetical protein PKM73_05805 [Verrucomicrobiota bacterium]|nr:hypothetical protein [Verrucomicrobiota bacterium]